MGTENELEATPAWKLVQAELSKAAEARSAGNEGMARVCARRAAGIAAGVYLEKHGGSQPGASAYDRLRMLYEIANLSEQARQAVDHLLIRVTPEHSLPIPADLIAEARWLAQYLLMDGSDPHPGIEN
jgi:hypothetical protein